MCHSVHTSLLKPFAYLMAVALDMKNTSGAVLHNMFIILKEVFKNPSHGEIPLIMIINVMLRNPNQCHDPDAQYLQWSTLG